MGNEHDDQHLKFTALYMGVVVSNRDPEKVGRVTVRIPGLIDEESGWAHPLGWGGSGGPQSGWFDVPPEGAEVGVLFHQGDIDHPHYLCGHPGRGEAPPEVESAEDNVLVKVLETVRWRITLDERPGKHLLQLRDKKTEDVVEIDGAALGVRIKATSALILETNGSVDIKGSAVRINGRPVLPNGKPI